MTPEQQQKVLNNIESEVKWYATYGESAEIKQLLLCQDRMTILGFTLAEIVSSAKLAYSATATRKKAKQIEKEFEYKQDGIKPTEAKNKAFLDIRVFEETENTEKAYFALVDLKRQQLNRVIEAIKQRISYAKQEKERTERMPTENA